MHVFIIASITTDGFIARHRDQNSLNWTSREDTQFFLKRSRQARVVVMGRPTFDTIEPKYKPLKNRLNIVYTRQTQENFYDQGDWAKDTSKFRVTQAEPTDLIKQLAAESYDELAVCGGATIYTKFLQAGVVDTLYLVQEPIFFGQGISLFNQAIEQDFQFNLIKSEKLNSQGTLLLEFKLSEEKISKK